MLELTTTGADVLLPVKVVPGASRTRCLGVLGGRLKIAVAAPPEKGKANAELAQFLAEWLNVRRRNVAVIHGHTTPIKTVKITNATPEQIRRAIAAL